MGGKSSPDTPNYTQLAQQQAQANIKAARLSGQLSNPNIITPYGSQTVTFGENRQFDQNAYDQAMRNYNNSLANYNPSSPYTSGTAAYLGVSRPDLFYGGTTPTGSAPEAPNREDFYFGGSADQPTIRQTLNPTQQMLLDYQNRFQLGMGGIAQNMLPQLEQMYSQPFDMSGLPEISSGVTERDQVTQALIDRNQPFMDRQRQQAENNLMLQGHSRGGSAWQSGQQDLARQENDARLAAILAGGQEQSRLYGLESANRARAMNEALMQRQLPLEEFRSFASAVQPVQLPFPNYQGQAVGSAPIFEAGQQQYAADLAESNAQNAKNANTWSTIGSIGAGFMFSDRLLKRSINKIGEAFGLPLYTFKYLWSDSLEIGFMADEVKDKYPQAVHTHESGYMVVNYGAIH